MDYQTRFDALNEKQKLAASHTEGPLMVVAGPGTGKTELLSLRVATILKKTDTLPSSILCLTFTESGATAMRERLRGIIGQDAYKVAIHTFHSFGSEIINQHAEYFYQGATFSPADELTRYEVLQEILDKLDYNNPLASKMNEAYTYMNDILSTLSDLKRSGLTSDELLQILEADEAVYDTIEREIATVFEPRISKQTAANLAPLADMVAQLPNMKLPPEISALEDVLSSSISQAVNDAESENSTKPITAWKKKWLAKNSTGQTIFAGRKQIEKLRAMSYIYYQYLARMQELELYDFDDMLLQSIHAIETHSDLRYDLQEKYLYILVDEFQDTNIAQARLLHNLALRPNDDAPNIMVVGDDDQAIYRFQGADVSNIMQFSKNYKADRISLVDNYRSVEPVLSGAHKVITQADERLEEKYQDITKELTAHHSSNQSSVQLHEYQQLIDERSSIAASIKSRINDGVKPVEIAVLARRHHELVALLPHLAKEGIAVNYDRHDNVLDIDVIRQLVLLSQAVYSVAESDETALNAVLPELLTHPAWNISPEEIWKLGIEARKNYISWFDYMATQPQFSGLHGWLLSQGKASIHTPLEQQIDTLIGNTASTGDDFHSPLYEHFFNNDIRENQPEQYLTYLEALRSIRGKLREYKPDQSLFLADFLEFVNLHNQIGARITSSRSRSEKATAAINLMTAHGAKGLEFDHVYIVGAVDSSWGERTRGKPKLIGYPENLEISIAGDHISDRLRLFYVAMTRAKNTLDISYSLANDANKPLLLASFLTDSGLVPLQHKAQSDNSIQVENLEQAWHQPLVDLPQATMKELLAPRLEKYKLSATHLNAFLDVSSGGPEGFLLNNLLQFPQAMSPSAAYGSAIHLALQRAHNHLGAYGSKKPVEDVLHDFEKALYAQQLPEAELQSFTKRGSDALKQYLAANYSTFTASQKAELSFAHQESRVDDAHLSGVLDLADIDADAKTILVTDYKTGKPSRNWQGKGEYEKIKLHKYRQQLMFYQLLVENSRDYSKYRFAGGVLQFVEPEKDSGDILALEQQFSREELDEFSMLVKAVWQRIISLDLPNITSYDPSLKGILAFETYMLDTSS